MVSMRVTLCLIGLLLLLATSLVPLSYAGASIAEESEPVWFGFELEAIISMATCLLAVLLFAISFTAYRRNRRRRLLYVMSAFLLFAIKAFLIALDEVTPSEVFFIEPVAQLFDFGVLALFFFGLVKE